ncbi:Endonuclease 8 [bacterium HR29]|nr:Endonuclease 8 [bacterium HR29]
MPEGDALARFARKVAEALEGRTVLRAEARGPGPVPKVELLAGQQVESVTSVGKNLLIRFANGLTLRSHLRMYGTWHVYRPGQPWRRPPERARLVLETAEAVVVNFDAPIVELFETRAEPFHRPLAGLGPDLLAEDFDPEEALRRFRDPALAGLAIGDAIMDQRVMAGVGNIWKHETLFRCGIYPWRRVRDLGDDDLRALIETARRLLRAAAGLEPGVRRPAYFVYGKAGRLCRRCGARLRGAPQVADVRLTVWCPRCQPPQPGDPPPGRAGVG